MSTISNWSYTSIATITPQGVRDEFGDVVAGTPYSIKCTFRIGGDRKYTDKNGIEFTPAMTIWTEMIKTDGTPSPAPTVNDTATCQGVSFPIRSVIQDDISMFGEARNDWTIVC